MGAFSACVGPESRTLLHRWTSITAACADDRGRSNVSPPNLSSTSPPSASGSATAGSNGGERLAMVVNQIKSKQEQEQEGLPSDIVDSNGASNLTPDQLATWAAREPRWRQTTFEE